MSGDNYNTLGMSETCLNCGKKGCALAGVGNRARINENNGCWVPQVYKRPNLSGLYWWIIGMCTASLIWIIGLEVLQ